MKDRIFKLTKLLLHTCMFNTFSIVSGSLLTFAALAVLSLYLPTATTLILCPFISLGLYLCVATLTNKISDIIERYDFQSCTLGIIIGSLWIVLLACA